MRRNSQKLVKNLPLSVVLILVAAVYLLSQHFFTDNSDTAVIFADSGYSAGDIASDELKLCFIDVGQGDSTLIKTPDGKFMLIDAGTYESSPKLCGYLTEMGVSEIEYLVFTHPHEDHIGSGADIVNGFKVKNVIMTQKQALSATYERLVDALLDSKTRNGTKIIAPSVSDEYEFSDVSFEVLSADGKNSDTNNSSIVIRLAYKDCYFMFTGDAERGIEKDIVKEMSALDKDISCILLKCGHHGSDTSSCEDFLSAVNPQVAVVSCGLDNSYGHPSTKTLKRLYERDISVYRTDESGDIVFSCDGQGLYVESTSRQICDLAA